MYVEGSADLCSTSRPGENSRLVTMEIKANDAKSVAFPIVPIKLGQIGIKVFATAYIIIQGQEIDGAVDAVRRNVLVVVRSLPLSSFRSNLW